MRHRLIRITGPVDGGCIPGKSKTPPSVKIQIAMATSSQAGFTDQMIQVLDRLRIEMENFRLQAALGKMDAADKFEELKKEYVPVIRQAIAALESGQTTLRARAEEFRPELEHLLVQLALGKAELIGAYEQQKARILAAVRKAEQHLGWDDLTNPVTGKSLRHEFERLKLNVELMRLRYELKKLDTEEEWNNRVVAVFEHWKEKIRENREDWDKRAEKVMEEMQHAYDHIRKAIEQI
jgi:gas vesicle protein